MTGLPFVGRREELDAVSRAWRAVRTAPDRARIVVVTGDAGTGKSRLVAEAVDRLAPRPARVLVGQARTHAPAPYDWMASALSGHDPADLPDPAGQPLPRDALAWLTQRPDLPARRFAPEALLRVAVDTVRAVLSTAPPGPPGAPAGARRDRARAGGRRDRTGAGGRRGGRAPAVVPGVLVVEDLHDLDPASLDLVSELASAARLPALLLVTSRTAERAAFPDLAARVLARLTGTPRSARWHLGPLATGDVAALVEDGLGVPAPPDLVAETHHRTGGNPLWLTELLATCRAAAEDGPGRLARLATAALPTYLGPPPHPPPPPTTPPPAPRPTAPTVPANGAPANGAPANGAPANGAPANGAPAGVGAVATVAAMEVLTAREREVIRCLAAGMTNQQVARALGISIRTVTVHVSNLFRKTGSASRTEAALWALRQGLAD